MTKMQNRNRFMDMEHRFVAAKGEEGEGKKDWEFAVTKCKLVYIYNRQKGLIVWHKEQYSISCGEQ